MKIAFRRRRTSVNRSRSSSMWRETLAMGNTILRSACLMVVFSTGNGIGREAAFSLLSEGNRRNFLREVRLLLPSLSEAASSCSADNLQAIGDDIQQRLGLCKRDRDINQDGKNSKQHAVQ